MKRCAMCLKNWRNGEERGRQLAGSFAEPISHISKKKDPSLSCPRGNRKWHLQREEAFYIETTLLCVLYKPKKENHKKSTAKIHRALFLKKVMSDMHCLCATEAMHHAKKPTEKSLCLFSF